MISINNNKSVREQIAFFVKEHRFKDAHKISMFKQTPSEFAHNYYRYVGYILTIARYSTVHARSGLCELQRLTLLLKSGSCTIENILK